ncbi:MAG: DUF3551 domain-containing protein [Bradyrhizobium sp.]|uniref:DUF3551 domain-containing protein n=1 Tax=Bradyrhizobium sp. TaxID=376 RepID=UPI001D257B5F|nr:DUF3551 domain-containing protein [Bradyrhizobium sp.]MBV9563831.1 DUF3551 domain-containing protein [Bradyrhizobium sp.]
MRNLILTTATVLVAGLAVTAGPRPAAAAHDYPWCATGGGLGYPGECSYMSYAQCQASASGRLVYCQINPRFAFAQSPWGRAGYSGYPGYYHYRW